MLGFNVREKSSQNIVNSRLNSCVRENLLSPPSISILC
jgi:hypothetical protein